MFLPDEKSNIWLAQMVIELETVYNSDKFRSRALDYIERLYDLKGCLSPEIFFLNLYGLFSFRLFLFDCDAKKGNTEY